ncbi:hypothetical protein KKH07_02935 [Patescibacteria group bacterium]|nr:hypothetical protein [Patescibacteria group bacterium]MBU1563966.1 hypothetical protein [Patescibacteria group bacterium]
MWKTILDIIFPIHCLGCGQEGNFVCLSCFKKIPLNIEKPRNNLLIASYYKNPLIKNIIHRYKYDFIKDLAKPLSLLMIKKLKSEIESLEVRPESLEVRPRVSDLVLIPIPLHKKRLRWRGFNQSELLANEIGQQLNIPVANNILIRTKDTLPQARIRNTKQRKENINKAFTLPEKVQEVGHYFVRTSAEVRQKKVRPLISRFSFYRPDLGLSNKTIILVDDISTTGATLKQAVQALQPLQTKQIWKLVVARG